MSNKPWKDMRDDLEEWIREIEMDHYPDALYSDHTLGYVQALREVQDLLESKSQVSTPTPNVGRPGKSNG